MVIVLALALSSFLFGQARAKHVISTGQTEIQLKETVVQVVVIGRTDGYIVGYKENCDCIVLIPDNEVVR